jgi:hypothetical protein
MMIIGCDFHPSWEQIAWLDTEMGETGERKLVHAEGDAERFCARRTRAQRPQVHPVAGIQMGYKPLCCHSPQVRRIKRK